MDETGHSFEILPDQAYDNIVADALPPLPDNALFYHGSLAARNPVSAATLVHLRRRCSGRRLVDVNLRRPWWQREAVLALIDGAWLAKLNDEELQLLVPEAPDDDAGMTQLLEDAGLQVLVVTRGADGAELVTRAGERFRVTPDAVTTVVDSVGAGDALTSVLILGLLQNWDFRQTLARSQTFASAIVGVRGATVEDTGFYRPFIEEWRLS